MKILNNIEYEKCNISFLAMKQHDFQGISSAVVRRYKAPIEKFNTYNDFQKWAKIKVEEIVNKVYSGRQEDTVNIRNSILKIWYQEVINGANKYLPHIQLLILDGITKDLKKNNDRVPLDYDQVVLNECLDGITNELGKHPKLQFDFSKIYAKCMKILQDKSIQKNGWNVIPSMKHDKDHFEQNVLKLKLLSCKTWCTKNDLALKYLSYGDFHIYYKDSKPQLAVKFDGNEIQEVQGVLNDCIIPREYISLLNSYIKSNHFKVEKILREKLNLYKQEQKIVEKAKKEFEKYVRNNQYDIILNRLGIGTEKVRNKLILEKYHQPDKIIFKKSFFNFLGDDKTKFLDVYDCTFKDLGIDEDEMFKHISKIRGFADFSNSNLTNLGNLSIIYGGTDFSNSQIVNLGKLRYIRGFANFSNSKIEDLGNLKEIDGDVSFAHSRVKKLGYLHVSGKVSIMHSNLVPEDLKHVYR